MSLNKEDGAFVLGLTGGIGSGKSTAAEYIVSRGFCHVDADQIGRELTEKGSPILDILKMAFEQTGSGKTETGGADASDTTANPSSGDETGWDGEKVLVFRSDGTLDRKALAGIVFNDPAKKKLLEEIMFGEIIRIIRSKIADAHGVVLLDAPLLFEAGLDSLCNRILLITCDMETRIKRVIARDDVTREDVLARISNQMPDEEKILRADYVIDNSGSVDDLYRNLDDVMRVIQE